MKKRLICLCLALFLLPAAACAQMCSVAELREQAQSMGRWTRTYQAHGRTIEVDIPILVPDVAACPVATVKGLAPCTPEFLARLREEGTYNEVYSSYTGTFSGADVSPKGKAEDVVTVTFEENAGIDIEFNKPTEPYVSGTVAGFEAYFAWQLDEDTAYGEDNPVTCGDALRLMDEVMADVFAGDERVGLRAMTATMSERTRRRTGQNTPVGDPIEGSLPGYCQFHCDQTLFGLPIAYTAFGPAVMLRQDGAYLYSEVNVRVYGERQFEFSCNGPITADTVLCEDVPLASVADVIAAIEAEIAAGHIRRVHALELGYILGRNAQGRACVYPAWSLRCVYVDDPKQEEHVDMSWDRQYYYNVDEYGVLPVLAQSAQVLSPEDLKRILFSGKDDQGYGQYYDLSKLPDIVSWEESK